jgi:hypothetical protein
VPSATRRSNNGGRRPVRESKRVEPVRARVEQDRHPIRSARFQRGDERELVRQIAGILDQADDGADTTALVEAIADLQLEDRCHPSLTAVSSGPDG